MKHWRQILLEEGKTFKTHATGNSMTPLVRNKQEYILEPAKVEDIKVGDIVFCKVKGRYFNHLVTAIDPKRGAEISNNHGHVNGWTKQIYGKIKEIL